MTKRERIVFLAVAAALTIAIAVTIWLNAGCSSPSEPSPTHTYTVEWAITVPPDTALAADRGPHVCVMWPAGVCMQCVANKSRPDSASADPPGGWEPPIWTLWGQPIGRQQ